MKDFKVGDKIKLIVNVGPYSESIASGGVRKGDTLICVHDSEPLEGYRLGNGKVSCEWANHYKDYFEDKEMQFTKDMLRTGMRVVYNNSQVAIVLKDIGILAQHDGFNFLNCLDENMKYDGSESPWSVKAVYEGYTANSQVLDWNALGKLLWKREEKNPAQIELESLQTKISELQDQAAKLQGLISK